MAHVDFSAQRALSAGCLAQMAVAPGRKHVALAVVVSRVFLDTEPLPLYLTQFQAKESDEEREIGEQYPEETCRSER